MMGRGLIVCGALIGLASAQEFQQRPHLTKPIIGDKLALEEIIAFCETKVSSVPTFKTVDEYRALIRKHTLVSEMPELRAMR